MRQNVDILRRNVKQYIADFAIQIATDFILHVYMYDEANDSIKSREKQYLYLCTLHTVVLSILNLLDKVHRLLYMYNK